jgi:uncharacterized protein YggE
VPLAATPGGGRRRFGLEADAAAYPPARERATQDGGRKAEALRPLLCRRRGGVSQL